MMATVQRPVMRYHGSKFLLAPWIISHMPAHRRYTEAYGGGASVLLRKPRAYAEVYNELDGEISSLFCVLRNPAQARELERLLRLTPYSRVEFETSFITANDPIEQARRTIFRSFAGFGTADFIGTHPTGFRANTNRTGSIPAHEMARYPDQIEAFVQRLEGVVIEQRPALDVLRQHDCPNTVHYVDPPYLHETRTTIRNEYRKSYRHEMTTQDHYDLAETLHGLKGMVLLSGYASTLYAELYAGWQWVERQTHADGAGKRVECLWLNPAAAQRQQLRMDTEVAA